MCQNNLRLYRLVICNVSDPYSSIRAFLVNPDPDPDPGFSWALSKHEIQDLHCFLFFGQILPALIRIEIQIFNYNSQYGSRDSIESGSNRIWIRITCNKQDHLKTVSNRHRNNCCWNSRKIGRVVWPDSLPSLLLSQTMNKINCQLLKKKLGLSSGLLKKTRFIFRTSEENWFYLQDLWRKPGLSSGLLKKTSFFFRTSEEN
jgi:hypothetical protein